MLLKALLPLSLLAIFSVLGCSSEQSFSGSKKAAPGPASTDNGSADAIRDDHTDTLPVDEDTTGVDDDDSDDASIAPDTAVTNGSFTAWTEPAQPVPGEVYRIMIEVHLPKNSSGYSSKDLSGHVIGTDGYKRGLGRDSNGMGGTAGYEAFVSPQQMAAYKDQFKVTGRTALLGVWVPGASYLVKDRIEIQSSLLKEKKTLTIVFQ